MGRLKAETTATANVAAPARPTELARWLARVEPAGETGGDGDEAKARAALLDAEAEKAEIAARLQRLRGEVGARLSAEAQREQVTYFDGWAPRDLPLLPSPIHRALLTPEELGSSPAFAEAGSAAELRQLPAPGTLPDLAYLPPWRRFIANIFGRLLLRFTGFLSLPQRHLNQRLIDRIEALEAHTRQLAGDRDHLRACLALSGERAAANFDFLDRCDRDRLLELHRKAEELRSEWRGDLERVAARLEGELNARLELKAPGHRLALLELEYAAADMKSQLARQRLLLAELTRRLESP